LLHRLLAHEQARHQRHHHRRHLHPHRVVAAFQPPPEPVEALLAPPRRPAVGVQRRRYPLQLLGVTFDLLLLLFDRLQPPVDAALEPSQLPLGAPPFFASRSRWSDWRTSRNPSAIRKPGGCSGPPWSSLRMPRTAQQYSSTTPWRPPSREASARRGGSLGTPAACHGSPGAASSWASSDREGGAR